ncbi:hypothetical protein CMEL01_09522 [Colletotrichum melonis]|uniref:Glutamine repeat protein-1 n=1 Tax=Colletotrichum melonis TaxID=1209925 RepID=A0AAI9TZQ8_9PEZI|nr:hypothetical protein CMEL01_09522 [Colletotrichum melonis]
MYAPGYGFSNVPPNFNTSAPPPNQNPHMQPGSVPTQPGQQMMYNPNQFAGMPGGQPGFVGGPNPAMMSGAGPAGMMQNAGMPHMAANGQMGFQNPYQGNPYGGNMPAPGGQHPNFGGMQGFPMNAAGMTPQQQQQMMMQQRMQAQQAHQQQQQQHQQGQGQGNHGNQGGMQLGSTPQRPMSAAQGGQGSPNNAMQQQQQQQHQQHQPQHPQNPQQQHQQNQQHHQQQQGQQQQPPQSQNQQQQHQQQQAQHQQQQQQHQQQQQQQQQQHQQQQAQQQQHQQNQPQQQQHAQQQQQQHHPTSQPQSHGQTPAASAHQHSASIASVTTPQTPTFPQHNQNATANGTSSVSTPLSPGSESREQERFSLLLEINQELLFESMQLQHTLSELKKETPGEGDQARKPTQEEGSVQQDYSHCMRRLQANLAYLAALADRKGNVQVPPSPAYLSSPPLNMALKIRNSTPPGDIPENNPDPMTDREERSKYLSELYRKLQALFPNADPKKEPPFQAAGRPQGQPGQQGQGQRPPSHHASPAMAQAQRPMQMQNMPGAHQQQGMSLS